MSLREILSSVTDPESRQLTGGILLTCLAAMVLLCGEVWAHSFPYRSARAAVRDALANRSLQIDATQIITLTSRVRYGSADYVVCGAVRGTGQAFAVAEEDFGGRRSRRSSWARSGANVVGVALDGQATTDEDIAILTHCTDIGA